jgi:hypothetical protein
VGLRSFAASWLGRWDILLFAQVQQLFDLGHHRLVFSPQSETPVHV